MCFDCLLSIPPFSSSARAGAKKTLSRLSRPNTPAPDPDGYGPPLKHNLNPEDLPGENDSKEVKQVENGDGTDPEESMDPSTGMDLDAVKLVDMDNESSMSDTKPDQDKFVYEQDIEVEIETSLDDQLPTDSEATSLSTLQSDHKTEDAGGRWTENGRWKPPAKAATDLDEPKKEQSKPVGVGHLEVVLEYEENGGRLKVAIMKATDLPNKKQGGFSNYRIRLSLRPNKQQSSKTRIRPVDSAVFRELFRFKNLPKEELPVSELLFKLHGCGKYGKERMVGDAILNLSAMKAAAKQTFNIPLVQRDYE